MQTYNDLDELYIAVKNHTFDNIDFSSRDKLIVKNVVEYYERDMKSVDSNYRFRFLMGVPIISDFLFNRRVKENLNWINKVFPADRAATISNEAKDDLLNHYDKYKDSFALFDINSQRKLLDLLTFKISGDFAYVLNHYNRDPQYLSKKIIWNKNPNIVDAGGFIGDTLLGFISNGIIPGKYYLYELEEGNYKQLLSNVKKAGRYGCEIHPRKKGVYSKDGELYFVANGDSSLIVDYPTDDKIEVVKIDSDIDCPIDFVKMDIEGAEVEALKGASRIIKEFSPTLAICIYHLKDDYWRIPLLIKDLNPQYTKFWIEHYQLGYNETVLYVSL